MTERAWRKASIVMTIVAVLLAVAVILVAVGGCSSSTVNDPRDPTGPDYVTDRTVQLSDGRQVICLFFDPPTAANGALSCDWANAK